MRLIDADWVFSNLKQTVVVTGKENAEAVVKALEDYNGLIRNAPTIDAVEVVRCKECKHRYWHDMGKYLCEMYYGMSDVSDENYCSYGERREDD